MRQEFDYTVIGGGCVGSAIVRELSRMGLGKIALLDNHYNKSATAQSAGMLRVFHEDLTHLRLALLNHQHAKAFLTEEACGSLYFFHPQRFESYQENIKLMTRAQYPFEVLTSSEGKKKFPDFNWEDRWAIYEPLATSMSPAAFCEELKRESEKQGTLVQRDFEVERICSYKGQFKLWNRDKIMITSNLILAGGARLLPRFKDLGLSLPLENKVLKIFEAKNEATSSFLPNFFDRESLEFGKLGGGKSIFLSHPRIERLLHSNWEIIHEQSSEDCYAPNRQGILGQVPGYPGLIVATGWGGTAFKFSLAIGKEVRSIIETSQIQRRA